MLLTTTDMGGDGLIGDDNQYVARDAIGFNLNYYDTSDYSAISGLNTFPGVMALMPAGEYRPLFNGNISSMAIYNRSLNGTGNVGGPLMLYNYHYDQLNRLTSMDAYNKNNFTGNNWTGFNGMNQFKERIVYDGNGNILKYRRHGHKSDLYIMDSLTYTYYDQTNRLNWVKDITPSSRYGNDAGDVADIDNQALNNYQYDEIGNLTKDVKEGITSIKWSVYGKILEINRASTAANPVQKITYTYDAQGNRISKAVLKNTGTTSYTWYARDAQGNVMATYSSSGGASDLSQLPLNLSEQHIYGSSRLGMYAKLLNVDNGPKDMADSNSIKYYRGYRQYELSNHLGNVLATISDKKKGVDTDSDGIIDYYDADVTTAQDYYPFGMLMPGRIGYQSQGGWVSEPGSSTPGDNGLPSEISIDNRTNNLPPGYTATSSVELGPGFESGSGDAFLAYISEDDGSGSNGGEGSSSLNGVYRYGFNGKENDNEVKGVGNQQDYGMRIYDPRVGRFLSVDPMAPDYPYYTPYQFAGNSPIKFIDLDGLEPADPGKKVGETQTGTNGNGPARSWKWDGNTWQDNSSMAEVVITARRRQPDYNTLVERHPEVALSVSGATSTALSLYTGRYNTYGSVSSDVMNNLTENQKQQDFVNNSPKATGILMWEYLTGTGPAHRSFNEGHAITQEIKGSESSRLAIWAMVRDFQKGKYKDGDTRQFYVPMAPDQGISKTESIRRHLSAFATPATFYRGGMTYHMTKQGNSIFVKVTDAYTVRSMIRVNAVINRIPGQVTPLGRTTVDFNFEWKDVNFNATEK